MNFNASAADNLGAGSGQLYTFSFTEEADRVGVVPEPATLVLLGSAATGLALARWRRWRRAR